MVAMRCRVGRVSGGEREKGDILIFRRLHLKLGMSRFPGAPFTGRDPVAGGTGVRFEGYWEHNTSRAISRGGFAATHTSAGTWKDWP